MNTTNTAAKNKRLNPRYIFRKTALAIFDNAPQTIVETLDLSVGGLGIISPLHGTPNSVCWIRLRLPETPHHNLTFDVKTMVTYSVFSNENSGFKVGLKFVNAKPEMLQLIEKIIAS